MGAGKRPARRANTVPACAFVGMTGASSKIPPKRPASFWVRPDAYALGLLLLGEVARGGRGVDAGVGGLHVVSGILGPVAAHKPGASVGAASNKPRRARHRALAAYIAKQGTMLRHRFGPYVYNTDPFLTNQKAPLPVEV